MRLYIQEKDNLIKYNLPVKVDGSLLFSYKSYDTGMENSINIDSKDGEWILKSNGSVNILWNNAIVDEIALFDYMCIPVNTIGRNGYICLFCLPSVEENAISYDVSTLTQITIGNGSNNNIVYKQNMILPTHATIIKGNDGHYIVPATQDDTCYVYVNNKRVKQPTKIHTGDVIFMNGLRVIWMKRFLKIPMTKQLFSVNNLNPVNNHLVLNNSEYNEVSEIDSNIALYNENEYFHHTPRIRNIIEDEEVLIEAPPPKVIRDQELPFLLSIGSSISMLGMTAMNMYNIYNNLQTDGTTIKSQIPGIVTSATMLIGSLLIPTITKIWTKKLEKKREEKRQKKYSEYLEQKEKKIQVILAKESQIIAENYLTLDRCCAIIENKSPTLWNREIKDDDFINVRLGIGSRPSHLNISAPEEKFTLDDDNLYQMVLNIKKKYERLEKIPIVCSLKEEIVTALILNSSFNDAFINGLILQLITYHSPLDLKIVVITDKNNESKWDYTRYLSHCWSDDKQTRYFASTQDDLKKLSVILEEEYITRKDKRTERENLNKEVSKEKKEEYALYESYYLIITDNFQALKGFKFTDDLLGNQFNYGFSMVIIDEDMKHLPKECQKFICISDSGGGIFSEQIKEDEMISFTAEYSNDLNMRYLVSKISNIPIKGKDAEHQLPNMLPFLDMYNVGKVEQLNIRNRWATSDPIQTLQAPVGVHTNGELFTLDLHEKKDGPHGLIAGSTGSGKSEFIITYILSLAINYDPKEIQFVLIDYKGGGLAGAFENREQGISIPHLAGTITNLDTSEMNRTLVSIESELKRRQKKFNEEREKTGESTMDIYKYQRLYREGRIEEPISHLFIISDEFAELKAQQPEFMSQLISTARIGRSLGVHLILATQKPSGVVNDQIWSNTKFRVCLKVQSKADSMEMLKRPEAASIKETGRFYLQVGYDEYFDIGQSAWTGEKYQPVERIIKKNDDSIVFVNDTGDPIKKINDAPKQEKKSVDMGDQLTNVVRYLQKISKEDGIEIKRLWLPSLSKEILYDSLIKEYECNMKQYEFKAILGKYDAPKVQKQGLLYVDLSNDGNILVFGTPGSGKENIITTIIYSLIINHSPNEINFYIGDFGSETLKIFKSVPHVGDVFITEEIEKILNLVKMLNKELERRKKSYADFGGNYLEYNKLSGKKDKLLVIALNNIENFNETYPKYQEIFTTLYRDGQKYGIIFIVTAAISNAIRGRVAQSFGVKVCLKMPNDMDYRDILNAPRGLIPADNFGRGIININGDFIQEFQTANTTPRETRTQFFKDLAQKLKEQYKERATKIPILPEVAYVDDVLFELKGLECVPIGIEKNSLEVYVYDFLENKINLIAAKQIKNHIYFIYALIKEMLLIENVNVKIIDALSIYRGDYQNVTVYSDNFDDALVDACASVQNDEEQDGYNVYLCLGISEFKKKISDNYQKYFETLFKEVNNYKNTTFLFFDNSSEYNYLQLEDWYKNNINNTYGIWLGEDIGTQIALGVMSLSIEDKQTLFPCIGYPVYQGRHMTIKYVVDGVDRKDEE